ncbi:hypothetical protein P280DRAFT_501016 [Massarina eburnea CBS 473.64]|uniref:Dynamin GTPase domain-containing protein n=1 Tax=Massarina eburnea CBS 473.64 TaxID=1395130 RepID=A0A6A6RRX4_9PLEO|nr:hypothetical protein P280DRAFT_501016 [Massarina eburnea CBS 473.64]
MPLEATKSSVLEAILGVSFLVKSNLCTRFLTELILRKTESESASLNNFRETLDGFDALPELIEKAKTAMAIGSFGRAFSNDLLRIEVSGPDRPHLTIVDLPSLIHSETKQQSTTDIELMQDVVKSYMKESRSIILAVIVLKVARAADKSGTRTLGVITKPNTLITGSNSEAMYVSLARNLDVEFRLEWHVLRNMDLETRSWSPSKRDENERHFFSKGVWTTLPDSILGIAPLRERLSKLLLAQIATELPSLIEEIELQSIAFRTQLQKLSHQNFQSLIKAAVDGTYNDPFFSHRFFITNSSNLMTYTRGRELLGTFNPMIISDLFLEQSQHWEALARSHVEKVTRSVNIFLKRLISHIADASTCGTLFQAVIKLSLEQIVMYLKENAAHLLGFFGVESLHPSGLQQYGNVDYRLLLDTLMTRNERDMNRYACLEALDCKQTYYNRRFSIETKIMAKLDGILSLTKISCLVADEVMNIAGDQLDVLVRGSEVCNKFMVWRLEALHKTIHITNGNKKASPSPPLESPLYSNQVCATALLKTTLGNHRNNLGLLQRNP